MRLRRTVQANKGTTVTAVLTVLTILIPRIAAACSVCYGEPGSPLAEGVNWGVMVLLGVTFFVLSCFIYFFVAIWRRSRAAVGSLAANSD